ALPIWPDSNRHGPVTAQRILSPLRLPFRHIGGSKAENCSHENCLSQNQMIKAPSLTPLDTPSPRSSPKQGEAGNVFAKMIVRDPSSPKDESVRDRRTGLAATPRASLRPYC